MADADGAVERTRRWAYLFEVAKLASIGFAAWEGPCRFPDDYQKNVGMFERAEDHKIIVSSDYNKTVAWGSVVVPIAFCAAVALPMVSSRSDVAEADYEAQKKVLAAQIVIASIVSYIVLLFEGALSPMFGTDAMPLAFDVSCTTAIYLAAGAPLVSAVVDVALCRVLRSKPKGL